MQVVILCGGFGTRLWPYTNELPKSLIAIGDKPVIWHIMKRYSLFGHKDFILCLGYLGEKINEYFDKSENKGSDWNVTCVDTGEKSTKAERLLKIRDYIKDDTFFVTYSDDVSDINFDELLKYHVNSKGIATITAINPKSQFGVVEINENGIIEEFVEKPRTKYWINAGFFVFNKKIFDFIKDGMDLETDVFRELTDFRLINAYKHNGFWKCMNTQKDAAELNKIWEEKKLEYILGRK